MGSHGGGRAGGRIRGPNVQNNQRTREIFTLMALGAHKVQVSGDQDVIFTFVQGKRPASAWAVGPPETTAGEGVEQVPDAVLRARSETASLPLRIACGDARDGPRPADVLMG